jgi:hypothetical protein
MKKDRGNVKGYSKTKEKRFKNKRDSHTPGPGKYDIDQKDLKKLVN